MNRRQAVNKSLQEKIDMNIWDNLNDFLKVFKRMKQRKWTWSLNPDCKYVDLRIDMRDGGCLIMNRGVKRIDPKDLEFQYKA